MDFMIRDVDINEISDGRRYRSGDMVKIGCAECTGCSECCRQVDDTIILDPYDIYNKVYDGYTTHSRSYIRADIRFHLSLLQQLLFLLLVILLLCL